MTHAVTDRALQDLDKRMQSLPGSQYLILRHMLYRELCLKVAEFETLLDVLCRSASLEEGDVLSTIEQHVNTMTRVLM